MQVINKIKRDCVHSLYDTIQKNATLQGFQWLEDDNESDKYRLHGKTRKRRSNFKGEKVNFN